MRMIKQIAVAITAFTLSIQLAFANALTLKNYVAKPENFGVTSTLISGKNDAILVNAQFAKSEAEAIAADIKASGKNLTTIFVSYGDPDFYFGLDVFKKHFPNAKIVATKPTVDHIQKTYQQKVSYWGPKMGSNAPSQVLVPTALKESHLVLEGHKLEIRGSGELTYLWIPSLKAVVGGIVVTYGSHLWMADTPTAADRAAVAKTLTAIQQLKPTTVVPAHTSDSKTFNARTVEFSLQYLNKYEQAVNSTANSQELIAAMQKQYPELGGQSSLELGAKVVKGEMEWH